MNLIDKAKHHFLTKEFFLFLIIGCINTFNGTFLAWLCAFLSPYNNLNFNIGYILSNLCAYWMNSRFIFHEPLSINRYVKFFISYIPNYIIQNIIVIIFIIPFNLIISLSYSSFCLLICCWKPTITWRLMNLV